MLGERDDEQGERADSCMPLVQAQHESIRYGRALARRGKGQMDQSQGSAGTSELGGGGVVVVVPHPRIP